MFYGGNICGLRSWMYAHKDFCRSSEKRISQRGKDIHVLGREHTSHTGHVKCYVHVVNARVPSLRSETVWKHIK